MNQYQDKFQHLMRELFQFDCADLDFGIYRIMNYKRDVIERFITHDLPQAIAGELDRGTLADQAQAARSLKEVSDQIIQTLGREALDADGNLDERFHDTQINRKYLDLQSKAAVGRDHKALEASIFNHLYTFFSRYYQDGDFISKRRYSKRQRYAIPYNGEEVYLYWANHDQYYVKTAEHFQDYTFTSRGVTVHFKIQAADLEQGNLKGDKRFFLPLVKEMEWDQPASQLVIPFEYRPLTGQEEITYGKRNQQDAIIAQALAEIPKQLKKSVTALAALMAERRKDSAGQSVTYLEHHLRQYTRRNTSDFFIHKDLKGFLSRELDFYLKNEVLNLDEMESAGQERAEGWFQMMQVIKAVGGRIIDFLDQIENFQKMLWEKRKFITETQYCITMGIIDESFYPEIAACEPQWVEWEELFHIEEEETNLFNAGKNKKDRRIAFLKVHPTLVLDTKHFDADLQDQLLASFENLYELNDGLLIHSENYQALNILLSGYREGVNCVYIDPPYNSPSSEIIYKNDYKHSSWIALMADRLQLSKTLLEYGGTIVIAIDDHEAVHLRKLMEFCFPGEIESVVVRSNPAGRSTPKGFSVNHEYALFGWKSLGSDTVGRLPHTESQAERYKEEDNIGKFEWVNFRKHGGLKEESPRMYYPIYVTEAGAWRIPKITWSEEESEWQIVESPDSNEVIIWPIDEQGQARRWKWGIDRLLSNKVDVKVDLDRQGNLGLYIKSRIPVGGRTPPTWWDLKEYSATDWGTRSLKDLFGVFALFDYPKAVALVEDCLRVALAASKSVIVDFFAGSGTTGHAVINLNREDSGDRKFILVEMADYFDSVLLPRIKKVTFTREWKDGTPKRMATPEEAERSPRIVKYIRLESYEDALNNIEFDDTSGQQAMQFDDYLLKYMLKWETRASETLLNVDKLARPFSYKLHIHADGQTRSKVADIPETFNYLLGLHVQTRRVCYLPSPSGRGAGACPERSRKGEGDRRRYLVYRGTVDHRQIVVIWRETGGWQKIDYERDKQFVAEQQLTEGADEVFVNGDSFISNAKALEPVFKARMFAPVEG